MGTEGGGGAGLPVGPHLAAQLLDLSQTTLGPSAVRAGCGRMVRAVEGWKG